MKDVCKAYINESSVNINWQTHMTNILNDLEKNKTKADFSTTEMGIQGYNTATAYFLNSCGPNVQWGWDIGWDANKWATGKWVHQNLTKADFKSEVCTFDVPYLQDYIYSNKNKQVTIPYIYENNKSTKLSSNKECIPPTIFMDQYGFTGFGAITDGLVWNARDWVNYFS